jgi:hypothetical protein
MFDNSNMSLSDMLQQIQGELVKSALYGGHPKLLVSRACAQASPDLWKYQKRIQNWMHVLFGEFSWLFTKRGGLVKAGMQY